MTDRPVLWVLVHDLGRTGVPIALERMLRWHAATPSLDVHVVAANDGPLRSSIRRSTTATVAIDPAAGRSAGTTLGLLATEAGAPRVGRWATMRWRQQRTRHLPRPDIVLVHGAGAWGLAADLRARWEGARLVVHLHELGFALDRCLAGVDQQDLAATADLIVGVTDAVVDVARSRGLVGGQSAVVPGAVDRRGLPHRLDDGGSARLVSIGAGGWRKGSDRAEAAAHVLRGLAPTVEWHWIGTRPVSGPGSSATAPTALRWHDASPDPWRVGGRPRALFVTSREDPLPLVALEAAVRAIPVAATDAGGLTELLAEGRGWLLDGWDPPQMAATALEIAGDPEAAAGRAEALRARVEADYLTERVGPRWLAAVVGAG